MTGQRAGAQTLPSFDPATGEVIGEVRSATPDEVRDAVAGTRAAQPRWAAMPAHERARWMGRVRSRMNLRMDEILATICRETGKPRAEAVAHDVLPSLLTMAYLERIAPRALRTERVGTLVAPVLGLSSRIEWRPFGVVGCIAPWNYPMFLAFMGAVPALLAGNAVVLKPSELTPEVGEVLRDLFEALPEGVATVVQGGGEIGAALVDAPCDKLCFIGSAATGRRIAEAAAKHLTPMVMELGGQDAAIVCGDADLDVATSGVLWGAFLKPGQAGRAIEPAYVVEAVADRFEHLLVSKLGRLRRGQDVGPLTVPRQLDVVRRHVADAVAAGARVLAGGPDGGDGGRGGLWFAPTVLEGRTRDMALFGEETFGPVLPMVRVRDEDEAVRRANEDGVNLTASVWSRDRRRGQTLASRLAAGTVTINDHATTASAPWGLWGGVGESGYGRLHGKLGVREFAVPVHVAANITPKMKRAWWYPYDRATEQALGAMAQVLSTAGVVRRVRPMARLVASYVRAVRDKL